MDPGGTGMIKGSEISVGMAVVCFLQLGLRYICFSVCVWRVVRRTAHFLEKHSGQRMMANTCIV